MVLYDDIENFAKLAKKNGWDVEINGKMRMTGIQTEIKVIAHRFNDDFTPMESLDRYENTVYSGKGFEENCMDLVDEEFNRIRKTLKKYDIVSN